MTTAANDNGLFGMKSSGKKKGSPQKKKTTTNKNKRAIEESDDDESNGDEVTPRQDLDAMGPILDMAARPFPRNPARRIILFRYYCGLMLCGCRSNKDAHASLAVQMRFRSS